MEKIEACSKIKLDLNRHTKRTIRLIHLKSVQLQQKSSSTNWNKKGVPSAVGFPHCAGSGEGLFLSPKPYPHKCAEAGARTRDLPVTDGRLYRCTRPALLVSEYLRRKKEKLIKACPKTYNIAIASKIFVGSILDDLCRGRPSGPSLSFFEGAVTGSVGSALDQKGSRILRNL